MKVNPELFIESVVKATEQELAFNENFNAKEYAEWKKTIREKFIQLTGIDKIEKNICPLNVDIESEEKKDGYTQIRFTFESEKGSVCPCYLLVPDTKQEKYPVVITLQGHSSGFHNSVGIVKYERDEGYADGRGAFAVQAVKQGYVALAVEQRGMGERRPEEILNRKWANMCAFSAKVNFMVGRTLVGERCWDISRAIDALASFKFCDLDKIALTGNSGGGTTTFYASCFDERIKIAVPSCAFCSYATSILNVYHCACNYIPKAFKYFEMQDLACMLNGKNLVVVTGKEDTIFPLDGVQEAFSTVKKIYAKEGAEDNCRMIVTPMGHYWCEDIVWPAMREEMIKLGWVK